MYITENTSDALEYAFKFKFVIGLNAKIRYVTRLAIGIIPTNISSKNFHALIGFVIGLVFTVENASCLEENALPQVAQNVSVSLIGLLHTGQFIIVSFKFYL